MSDFASLLGQLQSSAKHISKNQKKRNEVDDSHPVKKRCRRIDAKDFPPIEKVFLICPAGQTTGGPEALHQLCDQLNRLTEIPAFMVYVISEGKSSIRFAPSAVTPVAYNRYNSPTVKYDPLRESNSTNLMIWPECWTDLMIDYIDNTPNPNQCAIWWLSVDNNTYRFKDWERRDLIHLAQSEYAKQYLLKNGATHILQMTEYISDPPVPDGSKERDIDVLFNPLKGVHYTDEIRKRSGTTIRFEPVGGGLNGQKRLSPKEVRELLKRAKVYIDFGPHPGMDRLPREAALAGCLVVTNMKGAAFYNEDTPLPPKYKIKKFDPEIINKLLKELIKNFQTCNKDIERYRVWIRKQEKEMGRCVSRFIEELVTNRSKKSG